MHVHLVKIRFIKCHKFRSEIESKSLFLSFVFQNRTNSQEMPLIHTSIDDQQRSTSNNINNRNQILLEPMNKIVVERRRNNAFTRNDTVGGRRQMSSLAIAVLALLSSSIAIKQSDAAGKQHELILFKSEFFSI